MVKKVWQTDRRTDRQTDRQTENTICRAAWSQLKICLDSILNCFTRYECIYNDSIWFLDQYTGFVCNVPRWNIHNVYHAHGNGHHYDVTSEYCSVAIMTSWPIIDVLGDKWRSFLLWKLSSFQKWHKIKCLSKTTWAVGIAQLAHHSVCPQGSEFLPPLRTLWQVNCTMPPAHVGSLYDIMQCKTQKFSYTPENFPPYLIHYNFRCTRTIYPKLFCQPGVTTWFNP